MILSVNLLPHYTLDCCLPDGDQGGQKGSLVGVRQDVRHYDPLQEQQPSGIPEGTPLEQFVRNRLVDSDSEGKNEVWRVIVIK